MIALRKELEEDFRTRSHLGRLERNNQKVRSIFTNLSDKERDSRDSIPIELFIEVLMQPNNTSGIEFDANGQFFKLKPEYPIHDKESLKTFMLDQGTFGIQDNEKLQLCYFEVINDMEQLIEEGWIRVVEISDNYRQKEEKLRIFFPRN